MKFNLIGAGRLGKAIAGSLNALKEIKLEAICSANFQNAKIAVDQIGSGTAVANLKNLPFAELTFITTPDDQIAQIAHELAEEKILAPGTIVVHCSGALPSTILTPLKALNCQIASFHPLKTFNAAYSNESVFRNCDCVMEGECSALEQISFLFKQLGAKIILINAKNKTLYHAAAVIASNYLVTLAATAIKLFDEAGIPKDRAKSMVTHLMTSSLNDIQHTNNLATALTGPLQRGDLNTLRMHWEALEKREIKALYSSAAELTLALTTLSDEQKSVILALLKD